MRNYSGVQNEGDATRDLILLADSSEILVAAETLYQGKRNSEGGS